MKHLFIVTAILLLLSTPNIYAEVNMKDASYNVAFKDLPELTRTYNSRSIYKGFFGFGWCSTIEKSLQIINAHRLVFRDCDQDLEFGIQSEDHASRMRIYESQTKVYQIEYKNSLYVLRKNNEQLVFNKKGQLIQINQKQKKLTIKYKDKRPLELGTRNGSFKVFFNSFNTISKISDRTKALGIYSYRDGNLTGVTDSQKQTFVFEYNTLNNMESITTPNKSRTRIAYNNDSDQVVKVIKPNGCQEYFDFSTSNTDTLYQLSRVVQKCPDKQPLTKTFEFWSELGEDNVHYLKRYKIQYISGKSKSNIEIFYHPTTDNPIKIIRNGEQIY